MGLSDSLLFLAPQLYGSPGGVQTYLRRLREIMSDYAKDRGISCRCLSLNDKPEGTQTQAPSVDRTTFQGFGGSKRRFLLATMAAAWTNRGAPLVVGHLNLSPIAWTLSRLGLSGPYIQVLYGIEAWKRAPVLKARGAKGAMPIVAVAAHTADVFGRLHGIHRQRFVVVAPAVLDRELAPRIPAGANRPLRLLSVGRMAHHDRPKRFDTLLMAVAQASGMEADLHLTLVGDGEERPRLQALAAQLGIETQVDFTGWIGEEALHERYAQSDVFVLPSAKEGFGIVFIEAMARGMPCIGGNQGGTPEVISHGETGFLVEPGDTNDLATKIVALHQDPGLRQRMGARGYESVRERFLFSRMRDEWFNLLDDLVRRA